MALSCAYCRRVVCVALTVVGVTCWCGQAAAAGEDTTATTVTHSEPPRAGNFWTPARIRAATPMPLPSVDSPPVAQPATPAPDLGPVGSSPSWPANPSHQSTH